MTEVQDFPLFITSAEDIVRSCNNNTLHVFRSPDSATESCYHIRAWQNINLKAQKVNDTH